MSRTRSPFPGMDPYLEHPSLWPGVHDRLVTYFADALARQLPARYYADLRQRLFVETPDEWIYPDVSVTTGKTSRGRGPSKGCAEASGAVLVELRQVEVREPFIEIRDAATRHKVVTVVEVLSSTNKAGGSNGQREYVSKQREVLASTANLVEIDLLRAGDHVAAVPLALLRRHRPFHYLVVVRRAERPEQREVYPIRCPSSLPAVRVPLLPGDAEPPVDLQACLERVYKMGAYGGRIDYQRSPEPPLPAEDAAWARGLIGE
ncbi:MAG: DUF4058 family protein [Planctomycetes bacterium]|nr:DUF4058 family protein [Planctomycetota bacterium]